MSLSRGHFKYITLKYIGLVIFESFQIYVCLTSCHRLPPILLKCTTQILLTCEQANSTHGYLLEGKQQTVLIL